MRLNLKILMELAFHEALVRQAYKDSKGNWTWSVGITSASGHSVNRYIGKPQTLQKCIDVFVWAAQKYSDDVTRAFAGHELTEAQHAAALLFHYNTGAIGRAHWVEYFLAGDIAKAKSSMIWRKDKSLIPRRKLERDLFFNGNWSGEGTILEFTKVRANFAPNWSSGKRVNVKDELMQALELLRGRKTIYPAPTGDPSKNYEKSPDGPLWAFIKAFGALFKGKDN